MAIMALAVMPALAGGPVQAQPGIGERLFAYVAACRTAILTGEIAAFADLEVETEAVTDAMEIRGWRARQEQGLVVSLMRRAAGHGVCDISYRPEDMNAELMMETGRDTDALGRSRIYRWFDRRKFALWPGLYGLRGWARAGVVFRSGGTRRGICGPDGVCTVIETEMRRVGEMAHA